MRGRARVISRIAAASIPVILMCSVACGGNQEPGDLVEPADLVPPEAWASEVCTAFSEATDELIARSNDEGFDSSSPAALKESMDGLLGDALVTIEDLIRKVEAAGIPDVEDGKTAADHVMSIANEMRAAFQLVRIRIAALSTDDPETFESEFTAVGEDLFESMDDLGTFEDVFEDFEELRAVMNDSPACKPFDVI